MTADEFVTWTEGREGRWELDTSEVVEKSPEGSIHAETREAAAAALKGAIRRAGAPCHVAPDGALVRIGADAVFEPDVLVYCGPRSARDSVEIREPAIVVEVISQATAARDQGRKVEGYFAAPSVTHYLVLDPERRAAVCFKRATDGQVGARALSEGPLGLDPPGLALFVEEFFPPH